MRGVRSSCAAGFPKAYIWRFFAFFPASKPCFVIRLFSVGLFVGLGLGRPREFCWREQEQAHVLVAVLCCAVL